MFFSSKTKVVLGKSYYFVSVLILIVAAEQGYEYLRMESTPVNMTAHQAALELQTKAQKHWVSLTGLQIDCAKPVQEMEKGKVSRIFYAATDDTKEHTFVIEYKEACSTDPARAYQGVLEPGTVEFISNQFASAGIALPAGRVPYMEVGSNPAGLKQVAAIFAGCGLISMFGVWWSRRGLTASRS